MFKRIFMKSGILKEFRLNNYKEKFNVQFELLCPLGFFPLLLNFCSIFYCSQTVKNYRFYCWLSKVFWLTSKENVHHKKLFDFIIDHFVAQMLNVRWLFVIISSLLFLSFESNSHLDYSLYNKNCSIYRKINSLTIIKIHSYSWSKLLWNSLSAQTLWCQHCLVEHLNLYIIISVQNSYWLFAVVFSLFFAVLPLSRSSISMQNTFQRCFVCWWWSSLLIPTYNTQNFLFLSDFIVWCWSFTFKWLLLFSFPHLNSSR